MESVDRMSGIMEIGGGLLATVMLMGVELESVDRMSGIMEGLWHKLSIDWTCQQLAGISR